MIIKKLQLKEGDKRTLRLTMKAESEGEKQFLSDLASGIEHRREMVIHWSENDNKGESHGQNVEATEGVQQG